MNKLEPEPAVGQMLLDREGHISGGMPALYLLLHRDYREREDIDTWVAAAFRGSDGWMGAPVAPLADSDIAKLEYVGCLEKPKEMKG